MLKYCNGCKRDLEIVNFYSYKKSTCKDCINKKVECVYCDKEFNSTNLSKHIKQIHSTYNSTNPNDSTYNSSTTNDSTCDNTRTNDSTSNKTKSISTSNKTNKNNSTSEITLSDQLYVSTYVNSLKNKHLSYNQKDIDKINKILAINRKLNDKIEKGSITAKEKIQFTNNLKKLKDLNYCDERLCKILLKSIN